MVCRGKLLGWYKPVETLSALKNLKSISQEVEPAHLRTREVLTTLRLRVNLSGGKEPLREQLGRLGCLYQ